MDVVKSVPLVFVLFSLLCTTKGQRPAIPTQIVHGFGNYPTFEIENVTLNTNQKCKCQTPFPPESIWNSWSECQGQQGSFECHNGLRYRRILCSNDEDANACTSRQWQYCYHERSCVGKWSRWSEANTNAIGLCSRSCGWGTRVRIRMCYKNKEIGLFCASDYRRPYDLKYEDCTISPCPIKETETKEFEDFRVPQQDKSNNPFSPNLATWTVLGACVLVIILTVGVLAVCVVNTRKRTKETKMRTAKRDTAGHIDYQMLTYVKTSGKNLQEESKQVLPAVSSVDKDGDVSFNSAEYDEQNFQLTFRSNVEQAPQDSSRSGFRENIPPRLLLADNSPVFFGDRANSDDNDWSIRSERRNFLLDDYEDKPLPPTPTNEGQYLETIPEVSEEHSDNISLTLSGESETISKNTSRQTTTVISRDKPPTTSSKSGTVNDSHIYAEIPLSHS